MLLPAVYNIAEICARHGVKDVVLSPGSRSAPLTLAFVRHPDLRTRIFSDERSAAFVALGIALTTGQTVALVCTSGTAGLNYAPAIAEAYFQQVPLLVFTADRPPEWIDQLDGQTIRQQELFGRHIKESFSFPPDLSHPDARWHAERMISEALNQAQAYPPGPVHVNVPLREPFYPAAGEEIQFDRQVKIIRETTPIHTLAPSAVAGLQTELAAFSKILVVAGQQGPDKDLLGALTSFLAAKGAIGVGDIIANTHTLPGAVRHQDVVLATKNAEWLDQLRPDLLLTFGKSTISKNLKLFLRSHPPKEHWHLQPAGAVADTFKSLTRIIRVAPALFFAELAKAVQVKSAEGVSDQSYAQVWQQGEQKASSFLRAFLAESGHNEFTAFWQVLQHLPQSGHVHLANSMAVRYANLIGLLPDQQVQVFANRGTSGIDGSTSTAVGTALSSSLPTILLTGDMAFFYDRNALWHNYPLPNLRIVVFNNHGGGIFRLIDGPGQQPELDEYFETHQALTAESTAREFGFHYYPCSSLDELKKALPDFFRTDAGPAILEIQTDSRANTEFFGQYREACRFS
jgi:2-succinyl-5-enolpyruvyl-6-hydroxy-3-cyclohexene-1-carboxylate synthase